MSWDRRVCQDFEGMAEVVAKQGGPHHYMLLGVEPVPTEGIYQGTADPDCHSDGAAPIGPSADRSWSTSSRSSKGWASGAAGPKATTGRRASCVRG
jgi:hypothetical protein